MSIFKFDLGDEVKELVSGFTGIITGRAEWLNSCIRYSVDPQKLVDGKPGEGIVTDQAQLVLVKKLKVDVGQVTNAARAKLDELKQPAPKTTGGPRPSPARSRSAPSRARSVR